VPKVDPRQDHEVEMACSDLFQAAKNAREVLQLIKDTPEEVGLEGWVQEKIIKASDYLNTVREYLEGQQVRSAMSGNYNMGNMLDESVDNPLESALVRRFMSQHTDVLQQYGPKNVLAAIEDVASEFNADDELGTSDVSAYVRRVLSYLDNNFGNQVDENVAAALMAAGAAGVGGILANKIIAMIDDARDRVKDMKEKRKLEAELSKVEKYLDSSPTLAESKIVKTRK
jgi:phage baseplate assembly protein W